MSDIVIKAIMSPTPVIRPSNSPGLQGPRGWEVQLEYSVDGESWHTTPTSNDYYVRFSTDEGTTWGTAWYIRGEQGATGETGATGATITSVAIVGTDIVFTKSDASTVTLTGAVTTLKGDAGADGTDGATGASIISAAFSGSDIVFTKDDANTVTLADAVTTLKGDTGATGKTGATGDSAPEVVLNYSIDGATLWHETYTEGDLYVRVSTDGESTWSSAMKFIGDDGADGVNGADAEEISLQASLTHIQWKRENDAEWTDIIALSALKGDPGNDGLDGDDGADGNTWYSGSSDPSDESGVDGDFYLNTTSWDVFKKISGEWSLQGNIKGASGEGSGDVVGPASSVDGNFASWDGTGGNTLKDSGSKASDFAAKSTLTTKGDLYIRNATDITRLPVGSDGEILMADSGEAEGVRWTPLYATTDASNVYERGSVPSIKGTSVAADRYKWVSPSGGLVVGINGAVYALTSQTELDLSNSAHWDTTSTDYTVAANRKGKDFYVYACEPTSGNTPVLLLSASSTYPAGYTAETSRKIGGFHCLCLSVGTISGHPLSGFVTGDILPLSVWDLLHRPKTASPEGMVWCPSANIWVDIYLQSGTGSTTASAYGATITDTRTWMDHVDDLAAVNKRLLNDAEFQIIAAGGNEKTNISGSSDPGTTGGHVDTAGRRMISFIGCEDCTGVMWQWLSDQSYRSDGTAWGWKDLPGGKGNIYTQGTYGDVKLLAGSSWTDGARCGSRCRSASAHARWLTSAGSGARGAAEPV